MRANEFTAIVDEKIVLAPYRPEHVLRYHEWMQDEALRELTASEPLSLEEEYKMQAKWRIDGDKLTFIILARTSGGELATSDIPTLTMIGDVNIFFHGTPEDQDFEAEVEIMIAEPDYRRKGLASRALQLMLTYATAPDSEPPLPVSKESLVARIGDRNKASITLFQKLGFEITKHVAVFEETELRYTGKGVSSVWLVGEQRAYD
ncbi:acyl-CoA N-acyltransferase [Thelephora ganbajun]|uniref:Acyl-CoA N-acyltransferase n=1 Tax=Thelephora ganbajun TaxID=370292 RepID=A0ACB6Z2P1_THEGA|nr:acyl-CoA N-acyltransferase [Thelephora ganbajun]